MASLDTTILTDQYSYDVAGNVEEGLTRVDSKGNAALALAKSIDVSKDGLTYTVTLKDNLKWSNGDKLTAKDFVYSWKRAVDPKTGSEYAYLMGAVSGANDIISGKSSLDTLGIKAESDTEFTVTLAQPTPYFKFLLSEPVYYPLDQKSLINMVNNMGHPQIKPSIMAHSCSNQIKLGLEQIRIFQFMPIQIIMINQQLSLNKLIFKSFQMLIQELNSINKENSTLHSFQQLI